MTKDEIISFIIGFFVAIIIIFVLVAITNADFTSSVSLIGTQGVISHEHTYAEAANLLPRFAVVNDSYVRTASGDTILTAPGAASYTKETTLSGVAYQSTDRLQFAGGGVYDSTANSETIHANISPLNCDSANIVAQDSTAAGRLPSHTDTTAHISGMAYEGTFRTAKSLDEGEFDISTRGAGNNGLYVADLFRSSEYGSNSSRVELDYDSQSWLHELASGNMSGFDATIDWHYNSSEFNLNSS